MNFACFCAVMAQKHAIKNISFANNGYSALSFWLERTNIDARLFFGVVTRSLIALQVKPTLQVGLWQRYY